MSWQEADWVSAKPKIVRHGTCRIRECCSRGAVATSGLASRWGYRRWQLQDVKPQRQVSLLVTLGGKDGEDVSHRKRRKHARPMPTDALRDRRRSAACKLEQRAVSLLVSLGDLANHGLLVCISF